MDKAAVSEKIVVDSKGIEEALSRLAEAIFASDAEPPLLVGIHRNGVPLAKRLALLVGDVSTRFPVGELDITLYRDDLSSRPLPEVKGSHIPFDIAGRRVVLVDDVLYTGRTVRAALNVLADFGRPRRVELCVLVDRGGRELPIQADHVGRRVECENGGRVAVNLTEGGARTDSVVHVV